MTAPNKPTDRMGYFLNKVLANSPAKLKPLKYVPVIIVNALVSAPKLFKNPLYTSPNVWRVPIEHACLNYKSFFKIISFDILQILYFTNGNVSPNPMR